jgi:hypothetical protein
MERGTELS